MSNGQKIAVEVRLPADSRELRETGKAVGKKWRKEAK